MSKSVSIALLALLAGATLAAQQTSQNQPSLGDVARQQHSQDKNASKKVWTNDDFPSVAAPAPAADTKTDETADATKTSDEADKATAEKGKDAKDKDAKKEGSPEDQEKLNAEWKTKIDGQKAKIADLQREYDLNDREYKVFTTTYYADAGNRLRDQKDFHDKEAGYRDKMSGLKDQISQEQAKLAELQEQAHKAGANKAYD